MTATTQSTSDNSTKVATTAYVQANSVQSVGTGNGLTGGPITTTGTIAPTFYQVEVTSSCAVLTTSSGCTGNSGGDMAYGVMLGGSGATLTLSAKATGLWQPGQTFGVTVDPAATGNWTLTNSSTLTLRGLNNTTTLYPGEAITFVADADGSHLDVSAGPQPAISAQGTRRATDANYTMANTDQSVCFATTFSTSRTLSLLATTNYPLWQQIVVSDCGAVNGSNYLIIAPNGTDTINGVNSSIQIQNANGSYTLQKIAAGAWQAIGANIVPPVSVVTHEWLSGLSASGAWTQSQPAFGDLSSVISAAQTAASPASHAVPVDVGGTPTYKVIPDCPTSSGTQALNYTQSTDAWSCNGVNSGSGWTLTDGTHTVTGATQVTVTGGTVGGSTPNATLTVSGGTVGSGTASEPAYYASTGTAVAASSAMTFSSTAITSYLGTIATVSSTACTLSSSSTGGCAASGAVNGDCGQMLYMTGASAVITIPATLAAGCQVAVVQAASTQVSITGSAVTAATLHTPHSFTGKTAAQYSTIGVSIISNSGGSSAVAVMTGDGA